jgi:hypothetical protein
MVLRDTLANHVSRAEINDSGICLPPSPGEERKSFWGHTNSSRSTTTTTSTHRSLIKENEPFNISRESFDSYRRSFVRLSCQQSQHQVDYGLTLSLQDISGRSPVIGAMGRPSMGERPRPSFDSRTFQQPSPRKSTNLQRPPLEEEGFEEVKLNDAAPQPKKRGFLGHFSSSRRRAQSGGAELEPMETSTADESTHSPSERHQ